MAKEKKEEQKEKKKGKSRCITKENCSGCDGGKHCACRAMED